MGEDIIETLEGLCQSKIRALRLAVQASSGQLSKILHFHGAHEFQVVDGG